MYDSNFLELLKSKIVLSDIVRRNVKVIQRGRSKVACCPFHSEKTPSFHINDDKGFYHCFGCGVHGDVFSFLMQKDGLSFKAAIERLAEENNVDLPKFRENRTEKEINRLDTIYSINEEACVFFHSCLLSSRGTVGLNYVKKRGLNEVSVKKFRLGFAPNSFSSLIDHLKNSNFTEEDMLAAGVVAKNERNMYDKFRNRIMFPVFGDSGKVIAFSGRIIEDDNQSPKYMNSPETPIYHKSDVLFNYFFAKKAIYDSKCAILVEGNIDVLSLSANGIENVVAPLGTAVTPQQVVKLWKITDEIIVCFDGDLAGQNASKRMALMVLPMITPRKNIKIACLPNGQDPDSLMRSLGKNYFMKFVKENSSCLALSEFLWINELRDAGLSFNDPDIIPERKSRLEEKLDEITKEIKNDVVSKNFRNFYKNRLFLLGRSSASRKTFSRSKLVDYRANTNLLSYGKILASPNNTENLKNNVINVEKRMFYILAANLELIDKAIQVHSIDIFGINFFSKDASAIMNIFSRAIESNRINDRDFLLDLLEKNDLRDYVLGSSKFVANSIEDNLKYLYSLVLERSIFVLEIEIKELSLRNNNEARRKSLMDELQLLHDRKSEWDSKF